MDIFVPSIKRKYRARLINREKQWPPCHSNKLIRLEIVEREWGGRKAGKQTPLAYGDLFKMERWKKVVRTVLVEGDAGIGKTTLGISISEDWSCDKLFNEYELLLFLPLHHEKVASAGSLPELLHIFHHDVGVCEAVARYIEQREGEKVVIIADGWDELSECNRQEGSFLYQLLFETFPLISVAVTSRHSASGPLHRLPHIDRFVEIKGFRKEDIMNYMVSEFASDEKKAGYLLVQLENNPLVESICSVPLISAIVCHLWRCLEETLPTTMTRLYTKIVQNTILRNIQKKFEYRNILSLSNLYNLPHNLQQPFQRLCEFAFQMLAKNQSVFSREELVELFPQGLLLDDKILCFGLLQSVETPFVSGSEVFFHFLHSTFQDFLASLYLSMQPPEIQLEVIRSYCSDRHFSLVWRFFFGTSFSSEETSCVTFKKAILHFTSKDLNTSDELFLCHIALEAQNDFISSEVTGYLITSSPVTFGYPRTAHDCAAVLHIIAYVQECSCMEINFSNSGIGENQIQTLTDILASKNGRLQVEELNLRANELTDKCISDLFHRASCAFRSLTNLDLSGNRIGDESIKSITATLAQSSKLSRLDLSYNILGVSGLKTLENVVRDNLLSAMVFLSLVGSLTFDVDADAILLTTFVEALSTHCPNLLTLDLSENNLGVPGASALGYVVSKLHHHLQRSDSIRFLSVMSLNNTNLGDEGLHAFVERLDCVHPFNQLHLSDNGIHATGIASLVDAVCSGKVKIGSCKYLDLSNNPLGLEGTLAISRMFGSTHCQPLCVDLSGCKLTANGSGLQKSESLDFGDVGQQLCQMFQNNVVSHLFLDSNSFTGECIHILVGFMHLCPCLTSLYSCDCGITSDDLFLFLDTLRQLKSSSPSELEIWCLANNKIDDSGVCVLIDCLPSLFPHLGCNDVNEISLQGNPISSEVKFKLNEELRRRNEVRYYNVLPILYYVSM